MEKYKFESEEILRTARSKFMNMKLEDGEDLDIFFRADDLRKGLQLHGETISDCAYKTAIIGMVPTATAV